MYVQIKSLHKEGVSGLMSYKNWSRPWSTQLNLRSGVERWNEINSFKYNLQFQ